MPVTDCLSPQRRSRAGQYVYFTNWLIEGKSSKLFWRRNS
jgi:hypothetical protein